MRRWLTMHGAIPGVLLMLGFATIRAADDPPAAAPSFRADVAPILARSCLGCHNARITQGGFDLSTFERLRRGGKTHGAAVLEPGDPEASALVTLCEPDAEPRMPFKQPALPAGQRAILERWVRAGALFDGGSERDTSLATLVDPLSLAPALPLRTAVAAPVTAAAYAPDGHRLAVAQGAAVLLIDPGSNRVDATLDGHPGPLTSLCVSPDGQTLIAAGGRAGQFGSITIWDLPSRTRRREWRGHADQILAADLAPDGRTLATAGYDRLIKLWDVATGQELRTLKEHTDAVYAVAYSPDGSSLATAAGDRTVKVWDAATGRKRATLSDATAELYAVVFEPDSRTVLAAGADRSIRRWRLEGDAVTPAGSVFAHDGPVLRLVLSADGGTLVSGGEDRIVKLWDRATLAPRASITGQPDWPLALALAPDGSRLAVGRYDGSLQLVDPATRTVAATVLEAPTATPPTAPVPASPDDQTGSNPPDPKPELQRPPTLNAPRPRGGQRGATIRVALTGEGVGSARALLLPEPGITARLLPAEKPAPNAIEAELVIAPDARVGVHRLQVWTARGMTASQGFAVTADPEQTEADVDATESPATEVRLPATLTGVIDRPGDVDAFAFDGTSGTQVVLEAVARALGSPLNGSLRLVDSMGHLVAEADGLGGSGDPRLVVTLPADGHYTLQIRDLDLGGSAGHFYRIQAGARPLVQALTPLGVERGRPAVITFAGVNLGEATTTTLEPPAGSGPLVLDVPFPAVASARDNTRRVVAADGPQRLEVEPNDEVAGAVAVAVPGGATGEIGTPGDADLFRIHARKGERLGLEVYARRLGTAVDPLLEVLDAEGRPVPRAVLRPLEQTSVQFRDHPSTGRNIRLTYPWDGFAIGDQILVGREVSRIHELPRNLDDDSVFWGLGNPRNNSGERVAFLGTTPEHHPMGQPIYKVTVHLPGTSFPPGGVPAVTLDYRNDDGGPGFLKDSQLVFDPPADGAYLIRVSDVRGLGGPGSGYHLIVRRARPDFAVSVGVENPNIPRGGSLVVPVNLRRFDEFAGAVEVRVEGLPPGIAATTAVIEADQYTADLLFTAGTGAKTFSDANWTLVARPLEPADSPGGTGLPGEQTVDPGGPGGGRITVTERPNLRITVEPERVEIRPGEQVELTIRVERRNGFAGRVPIELRNLPFGVRVLHIGLNGVLVTEAESQRSVSLYAEPWVRPMQRPFYAVGRCEPAGTDDSAPAIPLFVRPAPAPR